MRTVVVVMDGIDEAGDLREFIVNELLLQLYDRGHPVVATSRPEGIENIFTKFAKFIVLDLEPLTVEQQRAAMMAQQDGVIFGQLDRFSEVLSTFYVQNEILFGRCDPVTTKISQECQINGKWRNWKT